MSYDEPDAEIDAMVDAFYKDIGKELYPEHKEQAISAFIQDRMRSYYLKNSEIIQAPFECFFHAGECSYISPRSALIIYTTSIELYLKSVILKPMLYGMFHNELVAQLVVETTTKQSGLERYFKLIELLCTQAERTGSPVLDWKSLWTDLKENQTIRNKIIHQGCQVTQREVEAARNLAVKVLSRMVEPVLKSLDIRIDESNPEKATLLDNLKK
ncbi:MAG: hypothetical protein Q9M11_04345 [Mariprofundaceae bacterium]|nr:hypothetical protein [Mariprofundaceae bacterium]